ncbi:MAG: formylmethanofuran dehydrogenase subunit B, partial [Alphaproteobacteria bacterium]
VWNTDSLFGPKHPPDIVYLGGGFDTRAGHAPDGKAPTAINCDTLRLAELFQALRAIYRGRALQATEVAGASRASLEALAQKIKGAKYGALVWAVADLEGPHGDLAVQAMCDLVTEINETSRFSCVPLGGSENALGVQQVCTWQEGFPLRTSFAGGVASYDPYLNSWRRLLESGEADAVLWLSAFKGGSLPFETKVPTVVLGAPGTAFAREPEVFIPVGTPGIDHAGHVIRSDAVTSLPLHQLRPTELPRAADVLRAIDVRTTARKQVS